MRVIPRAISNLGDTRDEGGIGYRQVGVFPLNPLHPSHSRILPRSQSLIHGPAHGMSIGDQTARNPVRRGKPGVLRHHEHEVAIRVSTRVRGHSRIRAGEVGTGGWIGTGGRTGRRNRIATARLRQHRTEDNQPNHGNHSHNSHQDPSSLRGAAPGRGTGGR